MSCIYVKKNNNICDKKLNGNSLYCKTHLKKIFLFMDLPDLIISKIIELLYNDTTDPKNLCSSCKTFLNFALLNKKIYNLSQNYIYKIYQDLNITAKHEKYMNNYNLNITTRIDLTLNKKCNRCNNSKCRFYYPLPLRLCDNCFNIIMINKEDLKNKYNINWCLLEDHYYKSKQKKIYIIKKEVKSFYKLNLEDIHLNNYKKDISVKLNIPSLELTNNSVSFVKEYHPNINVVESEYYTSISKNILKDFLIKNNIPDNHILLKKYDKYFINKQTFVDWNNNLYHIKNEYDEFLLNEEYYYFINEIQRFINNVPYFSEFKIEDIPEIQNYKNELYDTILLKKTEIVKNEIIKNKFNNLKLYVENFILNNLFLINNFEDQTANNLANSILKYPDKILYSPKYDPKIFIKKYIDIIYDNAYFLIIENEEVITWDMIYNIIKIYYYDNICKFCNKKMNSKDEKIKHEYKVHLKPKFKEDLLLFNNNKNKMYFALFDQPSYILNRIPLILNKFKNFEYEKQNNYIFIKKIENNI